MHPPHPPPKSATGCNAVYIGVTGRNLETRKREHIDAVKNFNLWKLPGLEGEMSNQ